MKNSRNSSASSKPPVRGGPSRDRDDSDDDTSTAGTVTTETTLVDANVKEYQVNYNLYLVPRFLYGLFFFLSQIFANAAYTDGRKLLSIPGRHNNKFATGQGFTHGFTSTNPARYRKL